MNSAKTPQQLADAIETLVASYVDEVRQVVHQAVERSLAGPASRSRSAKRKVASDAEAGRARRRSAAELAELCEQIYEWVCARPGESMTAFADETGLAVRTLQRPMSKLKADGRIRCVGGRNQARYFPAVRRRPRNGA